MRLSEWIRRSAGPISGQVSHCQCGCEACRCKRPILFFDCRFFLFFICKEATATATATATVGVGRLCKRVWRVCWLIVVETLFIAIGYCVGCSQRELVHLHNNWFFFLYWLLFLHTRHAFATFQFYHRLSIDYWLLIIDYWLLVWPLLVNWRPRSMGHLPIDLWPFLVDGRFCCCS